MSDLINALPALFPLACEWARERSRASLGEGRPLDDAELELARRMGVARPERVRVLVVARVPRPSDARLRLACEATGLLDWRTAGLTLSYAIFVREGLEGDRLLLAHELRHVAQYESFGSIEAFLREYLGQILAHGYFDAPLERDAEAAAAAAVRRGAG